MSQETLFRYAVDELRARGSRFAREEFGSFAPMVFREWGVRSTEDIGAIVFELVQAGQLSARPEDTPADFTGRGDLFAALAEPLPPARAHGRDA